MDEVASHTFIGMTGKALQECMPPTVLANMPYLHIVGLFHHTRLPLHDIGSIISITLKVFGVCGVRRDVPIYKDDSWC